LEQYQHLIIDAVKAASKVDGSIEAKVEVAMDHLVSHSLLLLPGDR